MPHRNAPGSRASAWNVFDLVPAGELDSHLALLQHAQQLVRDNVADVARLVAGARDADFDELAWLCENVRLISTELNFLAAALESECFCSDMRADGENVFLCAAHAQPEQCSAFDYTCHTLDSATLLLNDQKFFPSRVFLPESALKHLQNIARRIYRIFAHTWFHHRDVFNEFEAERYLYTRFHYLFCEREWRDDIDGAAGGDSDESADASSEWEQRIVLVPQDSVLLPADALML